MSVHLPQKRCHQPIGEIEKHLLQIGKNVNKSGWASAWNSWRNSISPVCLFTSCPYIKLWIKHTHKNAHSQKEQTNRAEPCADKAKTGFTALDFLHFEPPKKSGSLSKLQNLDIRTIFKLQRLRVFATDSVWRFSTEQFFIRKQTLRQY